MQQQQKIVESHLTVRQTSEGGAKAAADIAHANEKNLSPEEEQKQFEELLQRAQLAAKNE